MTDSKRASPSSAWPEYRKAVVNGEEPLTVAIRLPHHDPIGSLEAVTYSTLVDDTAIDAFTQWRNTYGRFFLTQFTATPERTRKWLQAILADERRMLFTIHSNGLLIGHYGFRDLHEGTAELDNLLRGERGGHPALMRSTVLSLCRWLFDNVGVHTAVGNILADNPLALKLHTDAGFTLGQKRPLKLVEDGHERRWTVGEAGTVSPDGKYYQQVLLHSLQ